MKKLILILLGISLLLGGTIFIIYKNNKNTKEEVLEKFREENCVCEKCNITNDACISSTTTDNQLININTADEKKLQNINGVGEAKAKSIIEYREENGLFTTIEDIKNVPGIGDSLFEKIKAYITV